MTGGPVGTGGIEAGRTGVPLGFEVPPGWHAVDPASVGAAHAAFVLVLDAVPGTDGTDGTVFTPNITIGVDRRAEPGEVAELADESVDRLADAVARVDVIDRQTVGDHTAPGMTQVLRMRTRPGPAGPGRELVQSQVHLVIPLDDAPDDRLVVELACTCLPTQTEAVIPDFQRLVASFHIREREGTTP